MSNPKEAAVRSIVDACQSKSADAVEQLRTILAIAKNAGLNLEVMELSLVGQLALSVSNYAERCGRLDALKAAAGRTGNQCDYSRFDEAYVRRCRGMKAGGLL